MRGACRDAMLDDLDEEFRQILARDGAQAARRWLRGQLASADWFRLRKATPGAPGPTAPGLRDTRRERLIQDLRSTWRTCRREPRFASSVILTIGVGMLGAATMLATLDSVLLRPLPYPDADRLVILQASSADGEVTDGPVSWVNLEEWSSIGVFDGVFAVQGAAMTLRGRGEAENLSVARVSPRTLDVLGIQPMLGRSFSTDEGRPGRDHVAILTHARWRGLFGGDPGAIGQTVLLDDEAFRIVGVLPAGVSLPIDLAYRGQRDILVPLAPDSDSMPRTRRAVTGHAKLATGVSVREAQQALDDALARQAALDPEANDGWRVRVRTATEVIVGPFRTVLLVMLAAALTLLLLSSANLTNLYLAHWTGRRRELAIRTSLGAGRRRLIRHLLMQGLLLSLAGGALGIVGSYWLVGLLTRLTPGDVPRLEDAVLSVRVAGLALGSAGLLGLLFGIAPAVLATDPRALRAAHNEATWATPGRWERRTLGVMVTAQVALAVMLLTGTGLLGRSFVRLIGVDPGFEIDHVVTVLVLLVPPAYPDLAARTRFTDDAIARFEAVPGVTRVGVTNFLPYSGTNTVDGFSVSDWEPIRRSIAGFRAADDGYFDVMRIGIVRGRGLTADDIASRAPVALVSESMARQHFGDQDPIGRLIQRGSAPRSTRPWLEIVGVAADVRHNSPDVPAEPEWYAPYQDDPYQLKFFVLRTALPAETVVSAARQALAELDSRLAPLAVQTMDDYLDEHVAGPRFNVAAVGMFAVVAIVIAAIGLFGVIANSVARRVRELGIRIALGASAGRVRNQVLAEGLRMAGLGVAIGLAGAAAASQVLVSLLRGVAMRDPATLVSVGVVSLAVAAVACYVPARRATRVDPIEALRAE